MIFKPGGQSRRKPEAAAGDLASHGFGQSTGSWLTRLPHLPHFPKEVWTLGKIAAFISQALAKVLALPANKSMSASKQKYSVYRDNDLLASDLVSLPSIMKFVREDARKEHSQGRPAFYMITGSLGFKRAGSHLRGRVVWEG